MDAWLSKAKEIRYDFYYGLLLCGEYTRLEFMAKYPDVELMPVPADISVRAQNHRLSFARVVNSNLKYNQTHYQYFIYGMVNSLEFVPMTNHRVLGWCLITYHIAHNTLGKFVRVKDSWILPLPGLNGKQKVSLLEIRNCVPSDITFIAEAKVQYSIEEY